MGQTPNIGLYQPPRGSDVGVWDVPVNNNSGATDYLFANVATINIPTQGSPYSLTLSAPPGTESSWSGPYQSQSALLRFTGTLNNHALITIPRAGFFMVENLTGTNNAAWVIQFQASGKKICAPPGEIVHIFYDGTDYKYLDMGRVGSYMDIAATSLPAWINDCTVPPYLNCDGTTFSSGTYPALASLLGGTTLPDIRGRSRASLNQGTNRISSASQRGGINGDALFSAGGADAITIGTTYLPSYNLPITEPNSGLGHRHGSVFSFGSIFTGILNTGGATFPQGPNATGGVTGYSTTGITVSSGGSGNNLPLMNPLTIHGMTLIRAA